MILGVDVGGTFLRYELRKNGVVVQTDSIKSLEIGLSAYVENILEQYKEIKEIYISFAGQVKDGVILASPNVKIDNFNIKAYFEEKYHVEFFIENDLNCAVLAEANYLKSSDVAALYVGSGLGLGVLSNGQLIRGSGSIATELGHIPYKEAPFKCGCGKSNCLELFVSGVALDKWKNFEKIDKTYLLNDLKGSNIYKEFIEALLHGVAITITLFNPEILVLGGGIIQSNPELHDIVIKSIEKYAMPISLKNIEIKNTKLTNASLEGAFLLKEYHV